MDELLGEFLTEAGEGLARLDTELVQLEQAPDDPRLLASIFRTVHTIKGTCGFLGLPRLEALAHASESVLGRVRDGALPVTPGTISLVLDSVDGIKAILASLAATEAEPPGDDSALIARLAALAAGGPAAMRGHTPRPQPAGWEAPGPEPSGATGDPGPHDSAVAAQSVAAQSVAAQSIRVSVDLLEHLMTMVSELVLTRNQLVQAARAVEDSRLAVPLQRLSHVTSELQEGVMKTRMQPIGNAWSKLPRLVRDLAREVGKRIELQMVGADTELDRQVLELIRDPLTHMVRNAADHGLETPAERRAAGKGETGCIRLNAFHEGGHVIIEVADDGRGLDVGRIREKAVAAGLIGAIDAAALGDGQVLQFIFRPGFSTAAQVTSVSGRGVGMDVVRTNIERIGGTIELESRPGAGTTLTIRIPLTLAIVSALIVGCGGERFAMPQISVVELVHASARSQHRVESVNGVPVLRLRDRLLPLVALRTLFHLPDREQDTESFVIVTRVGTHEFGIVVDRVFDAEEIVVKPVAPILRSIPVFSGNTILGDGSVVMILDPNGIAAATGELATGEPSRGAGDAPAGPAADQPVALLVFRAGEGAPKAVPLSLVARLEEVDRAALEWSNGRPVIQYRDRLMPLVPCVAGPGGRIGPPAGPRIPVVVFADRDRCMGLVVDEILDIVEATLSVQMTAHQPGCLGSAVVGGVVTDLLDAGYYLTQAAADWFAAGDAGPGTAGAGGRVLLVDDSAFFRNLLGPLLSLSGYEITAVESADRALALCEAGEGFDVIVTDIEMPGLDGFELARRIRADARWADTPLLALSAHSGPRDVARGRAAGFDEFVAKMDREAVMAALARALSLRRLAA